jgi:hypothetical protein
MDLKAPAGTIAEFSCASIAGKWRGSVIVPVKTDKMLSGETLKFVAKSGKQVPEAFEGQPKDVIESSLGTTSFEQAGFSLATTVTNAEKIEANSVV